MIVPLGLRETRGCTQVDIIYGPELGREQGSEAGAPWFYMPSVALRPNRIRRCAEG